MAGIVFYFEDEYTDIYSGTLDSLYAWNHAIKTAGDIDRVIIVNMTEVEIKTIDADLDFQVVDSLLELDGKVAYLVCPWDSIRSSVSLWDFDHDVDWYVFGPASGWGSLLKDKENGLVLPQHGLASCHSVHVATAVMFHRYQVVSSWR